MRSRKNQKNIKGFIFVEATFAVLIISIVLLVSIRGISEILNYTNHSKNIIKATIFSQEIFFKIQNKEFNFEFGESSGKFELDKNFSWNLKKELLDQDEKLAKYKYSIFWVEKGRIKKLDFITSQYEAVNGK